jgi:hypothetical protein
MGPRPQVLLSLLEHEEFIRELREQALGKLSIKRALINTGRGSYSEHTIMRALAVLERDADDPRTEDDKPRRKSRAKPKLISEPKPPAETVEELLARRMDAYKRYHRRKSARVHKISVRDNGPIGVVHMGDPHVDADGCDLAQLQHHVNLVNDTPGCYGATVGDLQNNWVGRLAALYGHQGTTQKEAWMLVEWLVRSVPWLYIQSGNHDLWSGEGDPLRWIVRQADVAAFADHEAKIELTIGDHEEPIRIWARHSFPGRSQWNKTHAHGKAAMMGGWPADFLVSGHYHSWGYRSEERPDGSVWHAAQVGTYKVHDTYAEKLGFPHTHHGAGVMTILDPSAHPMSRVRVFWDIEEGCDYLTLLRSKK